MMTRKIYAIALALGMFTALSSPSHAALSNADRSAAVATPAQTQATTEANASQGFAGDAPVAAAAPAPRTTQAAPVTEQPRKAAVHKARASFASAASFTSAPRYASTPRNGYRCH